MRAVARAVSVPALVGLLVTCLAACGGGAGGDQDVIDQLRAAGADLSQPRDVRYYLYVPDETGARQVAADVSAAGRAVSVEPAAVGSDWLVLVSETVVVDLATMQARAAEFGEAVERFGGEYDGWEAAASP